jgi:carbohydrate kinase (thermoresistant glucokinase family)
MDAGPAATEIAGARAGAAIVVMGVSGSGKTTIGRNIAARLGLPFRDADEFHPPANVAKMASGVPLTDDDRWPWLEAIGKAIRESTGGIVVTCSALKRIYRDRIRRAAGRPVQFLYLDASRAVLAERLATRKGHFFPASLLDSQLATLEKPGSDEGAVVIPADGPIEAVAEAALAAAAGQKSALPVRP